MNALRLVTLLALVLGLSASCGDDSGGDGGTLGGPGASCGSPADCRPPLDCVMNVCTATGSGAIGDPCIYTSDCNDGLYCSIPRTCQPEGAGSEFTDCTDSGDCVKPLVCAPVSTVQNLCVGGGEGDIGPPGDSCETVADCLPGLFCIEGECRGQQGGGADGGTDGGADAGSDASVDANLGGPCEEDVDCDDGSACTSNQCVGLMCRNIRFDGDEDGYSSTTLGACGLDCNDTNADVNPDHTDFETTRHTPFLPASPNFDWNCDGTEELQFTNRVPDCDNVGAGTCTAGEGWSGEVPACGRSGNWVRCTGPGDGCRIVTVDESRQQACR